MANATFMDKLRSFLGIPTETPRNDFRNPIWGSDDDDDGDELYARQHIDIYRDPADLHQEFAKQMHDLFKSFGSLFGDVSTIFQDDNIDSFVQISELPSEPDTHSNNIRDYYLKPGYQKHPIEQPKEDIDLDGKISSSEISGLLQRKEGNSYSASPFNGNLVPGRSFCQTIITTSVTKPDGTVETRRIVKSGKDVIEDTTTSQERSPSHAGFDNISATGFFLPDLASLFRNFY